MAAVYFLCAAKPIFSFPEFIQSSLVLSDRFRGDSFQDRDNQKSFEHIRIMNAIVNPLPLFSVLDQTRVFQNFEVERYFGLDHIECGNNIAHAKLSIFEEL